MDNEHCLLVYALTLRKVVYIWQTRKNPGLNCRVFLWTQTKWNSYFLSLSELSFVSINGTVYARDAKLNG